jgi:hypothetical protein
VVRETLPGGPKSTPSDPRSTHESCEDHHAVIRGPSPSDPVTSVGSFEDRRRVLRRTRRVMRRAAPGPSRTVEESFEEHSR